MLLFQEGVAEQIVDFEVQPIMEEVAEVIQSRPQEGSHEAFLVSQIRAKIVEVASLVPHFKIKLAEGFRDSGLHPRAHRVPHSKVKLAKGVRALIQQRTHECIVEQTMTPTPRATNHGEHRGVFQSLIQERIHEHKPTIRADSGLSFFVPPINRKPRCSSCFRATASQRALNPSFPRSAVVGSEELLEGTMARAREEGDEFLQAVP